MKKILLMRHAKSSWGDSNLRDFDRPLNSRGERDAPRMGEYLYSIGLIPDQIFSSPAARAKATTLIVSGELKISETLITWDEELYYGNDSAYINAIRNADNSSEIVMTVGHNPMTESAISSLSEKNIDPVIPTATITCFECDAASWDLVKTGSCKLLWTLSPKQLKKM